MVMVDHHHHLHPLLCRIKNILTARDLDLAHIAICSAMCSID